ncbi:hypothetical protein GLAREA_05195 [Glarea lozoyensis ATCC 20868]|uniref:Uncharacterized protein n=1 Tax=Glarea lozoyensis (strain ATCC 20868 / MF5171) TaxID=1116229 RepID=S3DBQ7_GLAL2|nr:uncharacterized protein GLAREA_05195 [Glarea lozoyensis ATCC 20868]EPE35857.1 hypothetical protein GLAREA_05195 [Glarea lozoyensis ATCC 20868]
MFPIRSSWRYMLILFGVCNLVNSSQVVLQDAQKDVSQAPYRADNPRIYPLPECERCPSEKEIRAPGVGFAVETSYGAAVVRLQDGSLQQIALIEGDASYTALFRRLATGPMFPDPYYFDCKRDVWDYFMRQAQRYLNKLIGRPANPETAILAAMVSALQHETQTWHSAQKEEINDVFDHLKLKNFLAQSIYRKELYATSAASAGYETAMCNNFTDVYKCENEELELPARRVLHIDFNQESLSRTIITLSSVWDGSIDYRFVDTDLGYAHHGDLLDTAPERDSEQYWTSISARIRKLAMSSRHAIEKLMLTGTSASDPRFEAAIREALHDILAQEVIADLVGDADTADDETEWRVKFTFATAQGAARVAKRVQEIPFMCRQTDECRKRHERAQDEIRDRVASG